MREMMASRHKIAVTPVGVRWNDKRYGNEECTGQGRVHSLRCAVPLHLDGPHR